MKYNCTYCNRATKGTESLEYRQGLYVHIDCIKTVEKNMFSGLVSLNKEILVGEEFVELVNLLPDPKPNNPKLGMDLKLAVDTLMRKGKKQEAQALQYFLDGLNQEQMVSKFRANKQRVSQIVCSLRKHLLRLGINGTGYCK